MLNICVSIIQRLAAELATAWTTKEAAVMAAGRVHFCCPPSLVVIYRTFPCHCCFR
jgi:hypothetical protein